MVRTLVEIQGGRVSIRETGAGQTEVSVIVDSETSGVEGLGSRLYTAEEVGDLQASEAELVAGPLRSELARRTEERDERERARASLEKSLTTLQRELHGPNGPYAALAEARAEVDRLKKGLRESRELVEFKDRIRADIDQDNVKLRGKVRELAAQVRSARGRAP